MFYTYGLTADSGGANSYSKTLSVGSTQILAATPRLGAQSLTLPGVASSQSFVRMIAANALRGTSDANLAALTKFKFTPHSLSSPAASPQAAASVQPHIASSVAAFAAVQAWSLSFPRINHTVVSAKMPNRAIQGRGFFRSFGVVTSPTSSFTNEFTNEFGTGLPGSQVGLALTPGRFLGVTSPTTQAGGLRRLVSKVLLSAHQRLQAAAIGYGFGVSGVKSVQLASRILAAGKLIGLNTPSNLFGGEFTSEFGVGYGGFATGLQMTTGVRRGIGVAQSLTSHLGHFYTRSVAVFFPQAIALLRGTSALRGGVSGYLAGLLRSPGHPLTAASGETSASIRSTSKLLGAPSPDVAAMKRSFGLIRSAINQASSALATAALLHKSIAGVSSQLAAIAAQHTRPLLAAAISAQIAFLTRINALSRSLGAASTQVIGSIHGISHVAAAAMGAVQGFVRSLGLTFRMVTAETAAQTAAALHYVLTHASAAQSVLLRASRILVRSVLSIETASLAAPSRTVHPVLSVIGVAASTLGRAVLKPLGAGSSQAVTAGKVDFKILGTASARLVAGLASRGLGLGASHTLLGRVVSWYHLFVPAWAQQQTSLLPPSGGPAEPPSFGAIDPADQTTFAFDWSSRADVNDPIVSATVVSVPAGMTFLGPVFTNGTLVEVTALPFTPPQVPATYSLRCTCVFASGRRSSFSIPVPIRLL